MYEADKGYLIVAGTSQSVDYISCAETLAKVSNTGMLMQKFVW